MITASAIQSAARRLGRAAGVLGSAYLAYAAVSWLRYGRARQQSPSEGADPLLDQFMPEYEIAERHHVRVNAPVGLTLAAACDMDFQQSLIVRAIFRGRELLLGSKPQEKSLPRSFLEQVKALGWGILAEVPGQVVVMGAVTQPWRADVVFRALPPDEFRTFADAGFVKIAWTLRAEAIGAAESIFRTETRAIATEPHARSRFRIYWSLLSPGVILIRRISLGLVKGEAERRARQSAGLFQNATGRF